LLRTQETYFEKIAVKAQGTQTGIKTSIGLFFSYCMERGIGDPLLLMKKSFKTKFTSKRKAYVAVSLFRV